MLGTGRNVDVDVLEGLTTAIIVDQERMGGNPRSTVGTATDAHALLRILFSRLGAPHVGSAQAFSFNVASATGSGRMTVDRAGAGATQERTFTITGGMCPRCEGLGAVTDVDVAELLDETKTLAEGAITVPGYSSDGWYGRVFAAVVPADVPVGRLTPEQRHELLYGESRRIKAEGVNVTYEGLVPRLQRSMLAKDVESLQPHVRAFVERAVTFATCPECGGSRLNAVARSSKVRGISIADAAAMQVSDLADWVRALDEPAVAPLLATLRHTLDSLVEIGLGARARRPRATSRSRGGTCPGSTSRWSTCTRTRSRCSTRT